MRRITKILSVVLCLLLIFQQTGFTQAIAQLDIAGHLASLHSSITQDRFRPLHLRYLAYDGSNNKFNLLIDKGDELKLAGERVNGLAGLTGTPANSLTGKLEDSTNKLMQYFFIGLALPNDFFWVNLRPDAEDNIIDDELAQTHIGKVMLEADVQLKKDTALYTSPQTPEGKVYWDKLYKKAGEIFGSENIAIPTLTRPWIVPDEVLIAETKDGAYIFKATLKVMLEQDYLKDSTTYNFKDERQKQLNQYSSQLIRELIIPKLTQEVNSAKRYASLRQVYYSLILAQWFKAKFYGQTGRYASLIDRHNLNGLTSKTPWSKTTYFKQYQQSFKDGEYNLQEQVYTPYGQTIRSYFSGGLNLAIPQQATNAFPMDTLPNSPNLASLRYDGSTLSTGGGITIPRPHFGHSGNAVDNQFIQAQQAIQGGDIVGATRNVQEAIRLLREVDFEALDTSDFPVADMVNQTEVAISVLRQLQANGVTDKDAAELLKQLEAGVNGLALKQALGYKPSSSAEVSRASKGSTRPASTSSHDNVRLRFEELRKRYGGKVAWLEIINELGLPERLGFNVPQYVPFEREYLKRLYDKYQEADVNESYRRIEKTISGTPGRYFANYRLTGKYGVVLFEEFSKTNTVPFFSGEERSNRTFDFGYYLRRLYAEDMAEGEFRAFVGSLLDDEFKPFLSYGNKDEWIQFFCDIRRSPDVERWRDNKKREDPFPDSRVARIACDAIGDSIKAFIFFKSLTPAEQKEWLERTKGLPLHRVFRSSNFDEDTFETSMAGAYMSEVTDTFRSLAALKRIMDTPDDTVSDSYLHDASYTAFLQEYITGEKGGIVFSNLCGYTSIEGVIGEPSTSVAGLNNTIIDIDRSGGIEDVHYGFYGEPRAMQVDGFELRYYLSAEGLFVGEEALKLIHRIWKKRTVNVTAKSGRTVKSPFSEDEIHKVREVAVGIEDALGFPIDIEFVFKDGQLHILQVRPITGENSDVPKALPTFQEPDVIYRVSISIGVTPENGYAGFIVAGVEDARKAEGGLNAFMERLGLREGEFIIATDDPITFRGQPIIIDSRKASRLYHHGIDFRERGTVVAGMPGILYRDTSSLHWRKVEVDGMHITISVEKVRYYSNGFKGILVRDGAIPIGSDTQPTNTTPPSDNAGSSPVKVPGKATSAVGGIDFRHLPLVTQAISNLRGGSIPLARLKSINLDEEWGQIRSLADSGITPSPERIREYLQVSCYKGKVIQDKEKIINCIASTLREQEEHYASTEPVLRDILVVLESGRSTQELKAIFTGIK